VQILASCRSVCLLVNLLVYKVSRGRLLVDSLYCYLFTGVILVMVSFPFVFSPCIECEGTQEWAKAVYYAPFIAIFQIGWAASQISHLALIPKMNHEVLIRTELLAIRL